MLPMAEDVEMAKKHQKNLPPFDFDLWSELAHRNPDAFEELRKLTVELAILKRSQRNRRRLKGLQWQIDQLREQSGSPLAACWRINDLMWEKFESLNDCYHNPAGMRKKSVPVAPIALRASKDPQD